MWRLRECSLNDEQLGLAVGLSGNAIQLCDALNELPDTLKKLPPSERRRTERQLFLKIAQLELYNQSDWPVRNLLKMHHSLHKGI